MSVPTSLEDLIAEVKGLKAEDKVALFRSLGMSRIGSAHTMDCLSIQGSGLICTCVPDAATWTSPQDVTDLFEENWEQRKAKKSARDLAEAERERIAEEREFAEAEEQRRKKRGY